tara:strand:+ start:873 stop:1085 length:213 start_codon:yes stop_codon:yes gene_type:complete
VSRFTVRQIKKEIEQIESLEERFLDMLIYSDQFEEQQQKTIMDNILEISKYYVKLKSLLEIAQKGDNDEN